MTDIVSREERGELRQWMGDADSLRLSCLTIARLLDTIDALEADCRCSGSIDTCRHCEWLRAKVAHYRQALEDIVMRCDDSDSNFYGTISTKWLRAFAQEALAAPEGGE